MNNPNTAVATVSKLDREMEYKPFGSDEAIKLSVRIIQDIVCIPTKSGKVCDDRDAMKFMMLCKARALNPFEGDSFLMGYEGRDGITWSLITAHQAFLKRAEPHPEFAGMRSGVVVAEFLTCQACAGEGKLKSGKPCRRCNEMGTSDEFEGDIIPKGATLHGGWATIFFKNRPEPMHKRVSLAVFKKPFGRWNDDPAGMIVKCAEADALRSSFPTKLGGLYLKEEVDSIEAPRPEPTRGVFGKQPIQVDVTTPTETASPEPQQEVKEPRKIRKATPEQPVSSPARPAGEASAQPARESAPAAAPEPAKASPLENDRTRLAAWLLEKTFTWEQIRGVVREEFGSWVDNIPSLDQLSMQQAKVVYAARAGIESAIVGGPTT